MISIRINAREVEQSINGLRADMEWVLQNTVNDLLKGAREEQLKTMRATFTIRNESFLKNSIRITQYATRQTPTGILGVADLGNKKTSDIWNRFEGGGTKTPTTSKNLAIPSVISWSNRARALPKSSRPRNLKRSFVIKDGGDTYIFNRVGKKSKKDSSGRDPNIKFMYVLKNGVRIPDRLKFYQTVVPYVEQNYNDTINRLLAVSLRKRGLEPR